MIGGVGKSTVSTNIALLLSQNNHVALLDIDITGPSLPTMTNSALHSIHKSVYGYAPVSITDTLSVVSIAYMLPSQDTPVIWRGDKKSGMIIEFLRDVDWESCGGYKNEDDQDRTLDYLIIDTPPGTTDEHISVIKYLKEADLTGAIIVTTPQEVALQDVRKQINFCRKTNVPILGVIENMAGFVCPSCNKSSEIFPAFTGGAMKMCQEMNVPLLGQIPLDPRIAQCCDKGTQFFDLNPDAEATIAYRNIVDTIK